ncbi:DUF4136 domain-containing protein [Cytophagaceae bacterium ABcell3]|nr:DUF4136 domain-containing protein [Cytophagaceae bacterium ABcell3]
MKKTGRWAGLIIGLFTLVSFIKGCTSIYNTYADLDAEADFAEYKSFSWIPRDSFPVYGTEYDNELVEKEINNLVNQELRARGMFEDNYDPDLYIVYYFQMEDKINTFQLPVYAYAPTARDLTPNPYTYTTHMYNNPHSNFWNFRYNNPYNPHQTPYLYDWNVPVGTPEKPYIIGQYIQEIPFTEGMLIIDIIDSNDNSLVWRGWSTGALDSPHIYKQKLPVMIRDIFTRYPVDPVGMSRK